MNVFLKTAITSMILMGYYIGYTQCIQCDENSNPSGNWATVGGMSSVAEGQASLAIGLNAYAKDNYSIALGKYVTSEGASSLTIGRYLRTTTSPSMIIGCGSDNENYLINGIPSSLMIGFNSNKPTLFVGGAIGNGYTGKVGIGNVTAPQFKLHIKADDLETAAILVEPNLPSESAFLYLGTTAFGLKYSPTRLEFLTGGKYVFNNGNVGIGTNQPSERLEIVGNLKLAGNISQKTGYQVQTDKVIAAGTKGLQLLNSGSKGIVIDNTGNVGINTTKPTANLQVNGKILTTSLQIPDPAPDGSPKSVEGYVLRSYDAYGNVAWTPQSSLDDGDWTKSGSNIYRATGNVGIGLPNPACPLEVNKSNISTGYSYVGRISIQGDQVSTNNTKVFSVKNNSIDDIFLVYGDGRIETKGKSINFIGSENQGNPGISFQNGSPTKYWIGHNSTNDVFFIGGTGGATPEMGAINILNGNVGIGTNTPAKALDVNGSINLTGDIYKNNQLIDFEQWDANGANISYNQGNVGIGITSPSSKLHISTNAGNTTESFFKIENNGQEGSGITTIGKQLNGGPVIIQQAGGTNLGNQGSTLCFIQKSFNNQVGMNISTFTSLNGAVRWSDISADCELTVGATENLNLRTQNGDFKFYTNAPLIENALLAMTINNSGQVGIHIDNNFTKLTVAGRIHAQEVKVNINAGADFVFDKSYDLPGIAKTEDFIKANKHLPGISSAEEMQQNGLDLGEMQIKLLQKIEELTLYVIELNKENEVMKEELEELKNNW